MNNCCLYIRFVYFGMQISDATRLTTDTCAQKHVSISTQKSYLYWLRRYSVFLTKHKSIPKLTFYANQKITEALASACEMKITSNDHHAALISNHQKLVEQKDAADYIQKV